MSNKIINLFQEKGLLFPETENEVEEFELINSLNHELPADWNAPEDIIKRGLQKIQHIKSSSELFNNEISELRMVARKGSVLPQHIIEKMKANHNNKND